MSRHSKLVAPLFFEKTVTRIAYQFEFFTKCSSAFSTTSKNLLIHTVKNLLIHTVENLLIHTVKNLLIHTVNIFNPEVFSYSSGEELPNRRVVAADVKRTRVTTPGFVKHRHKLERMITDYCLACGEEY
jgi:hypothetical protein